MPDSDNLNSKLTELKIQQGEEIAKQTAQKLSLNYINLILAPINSEALLIIPQNTSQEAQMIVFQKENNQIAIGCINPHNPATQEVITNLQKKYQVKVFLISPHSFQYAQSLYPKIKVSTTSITGQINLSPTIITEFQKKINSIDKLKEEIQKNSQEKSNILELLEISLAGALQINASDIHLEAQENQAILRYRIDGLLHQIYSFPLQIHQLLSQRIKLLAGMKINLKDIAQDGRFTIKIQDEEIEVRVSSIPGNYGDSIVMRILDPKTIALKLENLGLRNDLYQITRQEIQQPNGMIITTGPTGSGKTTLLYAILKKKYSPEIKIITLENPIEYHLAGITQTQIKETDFEGESSLSSLEKKYPGRKKEYTFASGLRAILRQDPDVILVGEIRDKETAQTAIQAALTGHLVLSTIHTNDAAGAILRLVNFEIDPATIATALRLIIAQRLVRKTCPYCRKPSTPTQTEIEKIKKAVENLPPNLKPEIENLTLYHGSGCDKCNYTGYKGRTGIFELIPITPSIEKIITTNPTHYQIRQQAIQEGMITMYQDGILKVIKGITTLEEIERVSGDIH